MSITLRLELSDKVEGMTRDRRLEIESHHSGTVCIKLTVSTCQHIYIVPPTFALRAAGIAMRFPV